MIRAPVFLLGLSVKMLAVVIANAEVRSLSPIADTTLIQVVPTNNLGSAPFLNVGVTQNGTFNRGLVRFDLSSIPTNSRLTEVAVTGEVLRKPKDGYEISGINIHRLLVPWSEGTRTPSNEHPGLGQWASEDEATWFARGAPVGALWRTPGGLVGVDYVTEPSEFGLAYDQGSTLSFGPSSELLNDVQYWIDHPDKNFGWILIPEPEDRMIRFTARQLGSRESTSPLVLEVTFEPPDPSPLVIQIVQRSSRRLHLEAMALLTNAFILQQSFDFNEWTSVQTNSPNGGRVSADVELSSSKFQFWRWTTTP